MSIDKMKVFFHCPNCGRELILYDYHENTSSERIEYFVVLNMNNRSRFGEEIKDGYFFCEHCGKTVSIDYIFQSDYCSVESIDTYLEILTNNLLLYIDRGRFAFSDWNYDETPFPAIDRLCCMYPENQKLGEFRKVYKDILSFGRNAIKKYLKAEITGETVSKGCILFPPLLKKVFLHDSVKLIGKEAFCDCSSLSDIYLPSAVTIIDEDAFHGCRMLKTIHMPDELRRIEKRAFYGCHAIGSIYIPKKLSFIGEEAFLGCKSLKRLWLPKDITIEKNAFAGCIGLSLIEVHDSIETDMLLEAGIMPETTIIYYSGEDNIPFAETCNEIPTIKSIEKVIYPEATEAVDETTFTLFMCDSIKHVSIPASVTRIGHSAFDGCLDLQEVNLPDRITFIGKSAFMNCRKIKHIIIPEGVARILSYTFAMCSNLYTIVLPPLLTEIGEYAFEYCSNLSAIEFPDSLESIGEKCFQACKALEMIRIPSKVKTIESEAFSGCSSVKDLRIENGVERIKYKAFAYTSIESVYLPESIDYVDKMAFSKCKYLSSFEVSEQNSKYTVQNRSLYLRDSSELRICPNGITGEYEVAPGTRKIGWGAFSDCVGLTRIILSLGVTSIESFAFSGCESLIEIIMPNSVTEIGPGAFQRAKSLKKIKYQGTSDQWCQIKIDMEYNDILRDAEIIYI